MAEGEKQKQYDSATTTVTVDKEEQAAVIMMIIIIVKQSRFIPLKISINDLLWRLCHNA